MISDLLRYLIVLSHDKNKNKSISDLQQQKLLSPLHLMQSPPPLAVTFKISSKALKEVYHWSTSYVIRIQFFGL